MIKNGIISKILNYRREYGTAQLIGICLKKLTNILFFYNREVIGCIPIGEPAKYPPAKIPVIVRAAERSDIPELKTLSATYKKRDFLQWINDNYIFYVAQVKPCETFVRGEKSGYNCNSSSLKNESEAAEISRDAGKIIGYVCVCPASKSNHKLVSVLKLKDTDYWAVDAYIHPEYRGKGINSAMACEFLAQAKKLGFRRGYGTILFNNYASRRAYGLVGEKEIGLFTTITLAGFTFHLLKRYEGNEEYFN